MTTDYHALITAELARLDGLSSSKTKRDATIRALAQANIDGESATAVLGRPHTIALRTYYSKDKPWYHNPLFQDVLTAVTNLYRQRDNDEREALEAEARRKRHQTRVKMIDMGKRVVTAKLVAINKRIDQGEEPEMSLSELDRLLRTVFDEERTEFNELPETGKGTKDDPVHTIGMTMAEWRKESEIRRQQAAHTLSQFAEDEDGDTELNN